jgi:hypothetical protein
MEEETFYYSKANRVERVKVCYLICLQVGENCRAFSRLEWMEKEIAIFYFKNL